MYHNFTQLIIFIDTNGILVGNDIQNTFSQVISFSLKNDTDTVMLTLITINY